MNKLIELTNEEFIEVVNEEVQRRKDKDSSFSAKQIIDGYHSFEELYLFRLLYNAALFNSWANMWFLNKDDSSAMVHWSPKYYVHKSWKHNDGTYCFGEEKKWFIVSAMLPTGLISNHYKEKYWDLFKIPEVDKAIFEFDGHTSQDVSDRLLNLLLKE